MSGGMSRVDFLFQKEISLRQRKLPRQQTKLSYTKPHIQSKLGNALSQTPLTIPPIQHAKLTHTTPMQMGDRRKLLARPVMLPHKRRVLSFLTSF